MSKISLRMKFKDELDNTRVITVNNCKEVVSNEEQKTLMNKIIETDVFTSSGGSLVEKVSSEIIKVTTTPFELV